MKIFISWSGDLSKALGEALRNWLPSALQAVKPYFTPNDIEKGARWGSNIALELQESKVGIFCLTRENLENPWIMFEAGAISKVVGDAYVCPILFELEPNDISGPLNQFQLTQFNKIEIRQLFSSINSQCGESMLDSDTEEQVFNMWWPKLEDQVIEILGQHKNNGEGEIRSDREILEEVLSLTRFMTKQVKKQGTNDNNKTALEIVDALSMPLGGGVLSATINQMLETRRDKELQDKVKKIISEDAYNSGEGNDK